MSSLSFKQGDIVVANVLFSEQTGAKKRLALVISNSDYNQHSDDIIVLKITSKGNNSKFDVSLIQKDLALGTIKLDSQIMVDNPVTTYIKQIDSNVGKISAQKLQEVKQKIKELYQL